MAQEPALVGPAPLPTIHGRSDSVATTASTASTLPMIHRDDHQDNKLRAAAPKDMVRRRRAHGWRKVR